MFGIADLVTVAVIQDGLQHLVENPEHCRYILGGYACGPLSSVVGQKYINQAVEFIVNNKINVAPYYEMDIKKLPAIAVVSSGAEFQQYIGDDGESQFPKGTYTMSPVTYATFDAKSIDQDILSVSPALKIEEQIWINVIVTNGQVSARVKGILVRDGQDTQLMLDTILPAGTILKGWKAQSLPRDKGIEVHSSMDKVTIQVNLQTTGQASLHRMLALIVRYCLKRGRQQFEAYGLQTPTFSYTPLIMNDDTELEFQTVFTIETMVSDSWIYNEFDLNDDTKKVVVHPVIAHSNNPDNADVELD